MTSGAQGETALLSRAGARLAFALVLVVRVAIASQFGGNYDTQSYVLAAEAVLAGENVYASTDRYNYSPAWSFVVAGLWGAARPNVRLFIVLVGLLQTACDVATAWLVFLLARRRLALSDEGSRRAALLFFSNPVSVAVSCGHGQFDGIAVLLLLAALAVATGEGGEKKGPVVGALLGASLIVKHVTAFHPLLFWRRVRRPGLSDWNVALAYGLFGLSFVPYLPALPKIWQNVVLYPAMLGAPRGPYPGALSSLFHFASGSRVGYSVIALFAVAAAIRASRFAPLWKACLLLFLTTLVFLPSYSIQYLVWPVALGSLEASPAYALFSGVAAFFHTSRSLRLPWPLVFDPLSAWAAACVWLVVEWRSLRGRPVLELY
jgi:hypothetical protein